MRLLITGSSGFIGQHILEKLLIKGVDVVILGRSKICEKADFIKADLLKDNLLSLLENCCATHLLHLAWYTEPGKFWTSHENLRWLDASIRLVEAFLAQGGHHVVISGSCTEYDWSFERCIEETNPLNPSSLYSSTKDATRRVCEILCHKFDAKLAWGRVFFPYGPYNHPEKLIPSIRSVLLNQRSPFSINTQVYRDYIHTSDIAEAFLTLLQEEAQGEYNIASGKPILLADLIKLIAKQLDRDPYPLLSLGSFKPNEEKIVAGDIRKLSDLGWKQRISIEQGLTLLGD